MRLHTLDRVFRRAAAVAVGVALAASEAVAESVLVQVAAGQESCGKVSGGKENVKPGATLALKATAAKGYGFAGWYSGSALVSWKSSWNYTVENANKTFTARFVAVQDDSLVLSDLKPNGYFFADLYDNPMPSEFMQLSSKSEAKLTISGLPPGIKAIYGIYPEVNGAVDFTAAGNRKPGVYFVTITAKNANGLSQSICQKWVLGGGDGAVPGDFDDIGLDDSAFRGWATGVDVTVVLPKTVNGSAVTKFSASGLPAGLALADYGGGTRHVCGFPTKPGKFVVSLSATTAGNATYKAKKTVVVADSGSYYVSVAAPADYQGRGTVKGSGVYSVGANVQLSATPAAGYCFAGWYTDEACTEPITEWGAYVNADLARCLTLSQDWRKAKDTMEFFYNAAQHATRIYAKFVQEDQDYLYVKTAADGSDLFIFGGNDGLTYGYGARSYFFYQVDSLTYPVVTVKNLPPGMTLDTALKAIYLEHDKASPGMTYENVQLVVKTATGLAQTVNLVFRNGNYRWEPFKDLNPFPNAYHVNAGQDIESQTDIVHALCMDSDSGWGSDWKMSVVGLPPGIKAELKGYSVLPSGIPTKTGRHTAVLTFTRGTGAQKETKKVSITIMVDPVFDALVGTFNGVTCFEKTDEGGNPAYDDIRPDSRLVTFSATKEGKMSAKIGKLSFSGNGWWRYADGNYYALLSSGKTKEDGQECHYEMNLYADPLNVEVGELRMTGYLLRHTKTKDGYVIDGMQGEDCNFFAKKNYFGERYALDAIAAKLAAKKTMYFRELESTGFVPWKGMEFLMEHTNDKKSSVAVTVDKKGVVKVSGKFHDQALSGSTVLLPETDGTLTGWLPVPGSPKLNAKLLYFKYNGVVLDMIMYVWPNG